jgi:hypothetical protein
MTSTDVAARSLAREVRAARAGLGNGLRGSIGNGLLREVALVAGAMLVYFGVRNLTAGAPEEAYANGDRIADFERWLGIDWEDAVQASIVGSDVLVTLANWVYIWGHWPVILTTAVVLYLWRRERYYVLRNALFISGGIGFLFFALVPVAPPRLLELGLVDTVISRSDAYRALQPPRPHEPVRGTAEPAHRLEPRRGNRPLHDDDAPRGPCLRGRVAARDGVRRRRHR